jgi:subtilase family serine protease
VFRAFLDSYCRTPELIEGNNQFTQAYSAGGPDFVVTGVTLSPETPRANGTFNATVTVINQGTGSGAGGYLAVWANQAAAQSCYALGNRFVAVGTLAAGASATYSLTGLPAGAAGSKNLRAFADSYCQASEMNEGNNQFSLTYAVGP